MGTVVLVDLKVKSESVSGFQTFMDENLLHTRAFEGNQIVELNQNQDDAEHFVLYMVWESKSHYEKYLGWRAETGFFEGIGEYLSAEPNIVYFNVTNKN